MEGDRPSVFVPYDWSKDFEDKFQKIMNPPNDKWWGGHHYTVTQVFKVNFASASDEEIYLVQGTSVPTISTHPQPQPFNELLIFVGGEGRSVFQPSFWQKIQDVYGPKLIAKDQAALLDVTELLGRTYDPYFEGKNPHPVLNEKHMDELREKYGTNTNSIGMKSEWLDAVHLPRLHVLDGTIILEFWARRGGFSIYSGPSSNTVYLWRLTVTFATDKSTWDPKHRQIPLLPDNSKLIKDVINILNLVPNIKPRRIQHCYEDMVIEKTGYGNFKKDLNHRLFDTAFMSLVKRKFTGNEEGYTPGDDKFRKFFQMQLKKHKNITPESIKFLLNNCCVNSLDLFEIHHKMHDKDAYTPFTLSEKPTDSHCDKCTECVKIAMADDNNLTELNLGRIFMERYNDLPVNTNITRLTTQHTTDLTLLDLFPNLESYTIQHTKAPKDATPIERLTRLKHLHIQNTAIAKSLNFKSLPNLVSLGMVGAWNSSEVVGRSVEDIDSESLANIVTLLPNLESIALSGSRLTSLNALGDLKHLTRVEISNCPHGESFKALTNIKVLKLHGSHATEQHRVAIGQLTQLEEFEFSSHIPEQIKMEFCVAKLTNLKTFSGTLNSNTGLCLQIPSPDGMLDIFSPKMEHVQLSTRKFNPVVSTFTNLKSLSLHISEPFSDADQVYETIAKLTQLESLDLSPMTNDGFGKLTTLVNLKELNIREQKDFDSHGAVHFKHFTKLRRVSFYNTPISDMGLVHLTKLEQLEYLSLKRTSVSQEAIQFLENHRAYLEIPTDSYY